MTIEVRVVPGEPYGALKWFSLEIVSGYRAGEIMQHGQVGQAEASPIYWDGATLARTWAVDTGYTVIEEQPGDELEVSELDDVEAQRASSDVERPRG